MNEDFPEPLSEEEPFPLTVRRETRAEKVHLLLLGLCLMVAGVLVSALPLWYGDGWIEVTGVVHEPVPEGLELAPLSGAAVTLFPHADHRDEPCRRPRSAPGASFPIQVGDVIV